MADDDAAPTARIHLPRQMVSAMVTIGGEARPVRLELHEQLVSAAVTLGDAEDAVVTLGDRALQAKVVPAED